ncbi:MAG TPA: HD-GYP domain-containing protein [Clostridiales bacterium]|nr:HD-GYP domain-containing protein [Clostridiales bacterium]HQH64452.1 HD-GYP domain-containing protein [Clostridiales bacterium]HQK73061.1 HD-GYP domain-containing protein [Clostridiales bacterium]
MVRKEAEDYMYRRKLFERRSSKSDVVSSMLAALQENSNETREHVKRMEALARRLAERLGLSPEQTDDLALLATLHDIGKVGIDRSLLLNHRKLTADEMKEMKKHPEIGYRIALSTPELINISESILCHHERWDGKGYPQGLSGTDIPLLSRIISIIDAFDAMTNDRSYRSSFSKDEALEEIHDNAGSQFDPDIADEFLAMMST